MRPRIQVLAERYVDLEDDLQSLETEMVWRAVGNGGVLAPREIRDWRALLIEHGRAHNDLEMEARELTGRIIWCVRALRATNKVRGQ